MGVMYLDFVHSSTVTSDIFSMAWSVTAKFRLEQFLLFDRDRSSSNQRN